MVGKRPSIERAVLATLAGVAVGATVLVLEFVAPTFFDSYSGVLSRLQMLAGGWIIAFVVLSVGFVIVGLPVWVAAHHFQRRHWYDAVIVGGLLAGIGEFLFSLPAANSSYSAGGADLVLNGHYTAQGLSGALQTAVMMAVAGAFTGLTIWRIAYRRVGL